MELLIKGDLTTHLLEERLITDNQHGFLKGRSCTTNLVAFMHKLTEIIDNDKSDDLFYLDFDKAFDTVPKMRLLEKMKAKGIGSIGGQILTWIKEWLTDRTQTVRVGTAESACSGVDSGVPQGSVLGLPLFDIFIDDLDKCAVLIDMTKKFADDTKGLQEINDERDRDKLQQTLNNLTRWAKGWGMRFNLPNVK